MIRPATQQDLSAFADLSEAATTHMFATFFGEDWHPLLCKIAAVPGHFLSYQTAHFLEVDGEIAGMLAGYSGVQKQNFHNYPVIVRYLRWRVLRAAYHAIQLNALLDYMDQVSPETYYIRTLAIYPQFRGRGFGQQLLANAKGRATAAGCTTLALNVNVKNTVAINAYKKFGMTITDSLPPIKRGGDTVSVHLMTKALMT